MAYRSLRPWLQVLEQQGMFKWVDKEVDKDWEIGAVLRMIFRAMDEDSRYGIGFRNIKGFKGGRVVGGVVASSRKMIAAALGCEPNLENIHERVTSGINAPIEPVLVDSGPCQEVVFRGDDVDPNQASGAYLDARKRCRPLSHTPLGYQGSRYRPAQHRHPPLPGEKQKHHRHPVRRT